MSVGWEKLMSVDSGMGSSKSFLGDRYAVVKELGHSGFGKTYLAKDRQMQDELCVLQELLPQISDRADVEMAKALFEQEGRSLFQLSHPQIPEFRGLVEVPAESESQSGARLFLAQDYIPGQSYQEIADGRSRAKNQFNETELTQLLQDMLPVLSHIHSREVIHRDISPENIILDPIEGRPVLINFAGVREMAAKVRSRLTADGIEDSPIRIGKVGYASQAQISGAEVDPTSDLYGLAATIMALATGESPETLVDTATGNWHGFDLLSPKLGRILAKMLAVNVSDRYPSAQAVLSALQQEEANPSSASQPASQSASQSAGRNIGLAAGMAGGAAAVASAAESMYSQPAGIIDVERSDVLVGPEPVMAMASPGFSPIDTPVDMGHVDIDDVPETYEGERTAMRESRVIGQPSWREALIALAVMLGFILTALLVASLLRGSDDDRFGRFNSADGSSGSSANDNSSEDEFLPEETARRLEIQTRREQLGIDENFFTNLVNQLFYQEYPTLRTSGSGSERPVTAASADEPLRIRWDHIALDLLDVMERSFNPSSLQKLGSYSEADRETWRSQVGEVGIDPQSLYDLVDAKFFNLLPSQAGENFLTKPTGQLYYALADSQAREIVSGGVRESVTFEPGEFSQSIQGSLEPGEGRIYTISLSSGQLLRLNLSAPSGSTLMSLYPPNPTTAQPSIFADSEQTIWSGSLSEGDYELVVINRSNGPISYNLTIAIDSVTSAPIAPPKEETNADAEEDTAGSVPQTDADGTNRESDTDSNTDSDTDNGVVFERLENSPGLGVSNGNRSSGTSERR